MPREITNHSEILDAIRSVDSIQDLAAKHDGHFEYELELEVIAYGRNYNGKKVGPYFRLLVYQAEEEVIRQNDWGGNTFYIVVAGTLDVYVRDEERNTQNKVGELKQGMLWAETSCCHVTDLLLAANHNIFRRSPLNFSVLCLRASA